MLLSASCVSNRVAVVGGAFTTAGLELCLTLYTLCGDGDRNGDGGADGLEQIRPSRLLQLPPEWNIEAQIPHITVCIEL